MKFELIGKIEDIETIAVGSQIRDLSKIRKKHGRECYAELHWYEAHGIGKKEMKVKELLD